MDTSRSKIALASLFMVALFVSCFDVYAIPVGGIQLKLAYLVFPFYVVLFICVSGLKIEVDKLLAGLLFLLCLLPGVVFSSSLMTSIAFFLGAIVSVSVAFIFCRLVTWSAGAAMNWMIVFYRFSIIITALLFVTRLQQRGHFVLYEASYYSIFLIPYFCISFNNLFFNTKKAFFDIFLIFIALFVTQSASMVLYILAIIIYFIIVSKVMGWKTMLVILCLSIILIFCVLLFTVRGEAVLRAANIALKNPEAVWPLFFIIGGNRLQRAMIAFQAFSLFPVHGVGLGALKIFSGNFFVASDFTIDGASAYDFVTDMNATNVFLEIGAEGGFPAVIAYCAFILWVFFRHRSNRTLATRPIEVALIVTTIALLIESSYLRTYVWALYGILLGFRELDSKDDHKLRSVS